MDHARRIADDLLFPSAVDIDRSPVVPCAYLDAIAAAGLYDLPDDPVDAGRIIEALGGASLVTTFVWIQHHSAARAVASGAPALRDTWSADMRAGRVRAGIAYAALRRPGPPSAVAAPTAAGWTINGYAPWVTGWGLVDVVMVGARSGDDLVWVLVDANEAPGMVAVPVELAAMQASATVELRWSDFDIDRSRIVAIEKFEDWRTRDAHGRQANGYLAVGVAARCCSLLGPSSLNAEVDAARRALDEATAESVAAARADASILALRAASTLVATGGGRSVEANQHATRLMREATFLLVFGQTGDIRTAQIEALSKRPI